MLTTALWRRTSMPTGSGSSPLRAALAVRPGSSSELSWVDHWSLGIRPRTQLRQLRLGRGRDRCCPPSLASCPDTAVVMWQRRLRGSNSRLIA